MAQTKTVTLAIICIVLAAGIAGAAFMLNQKEAEIKAQTDQISEIQNENANMLQQITNLQTETTTLNSQIGGLESEVSSLQTETSSLQSQKSALENEKAVLASQVSELESENSDLESQVSDKQGEISSLTSSVGALESQVSSLQNDVVFLEGQVSQSYNTGYAEGESEGYSQGFDEGYVQGMEFLTESGYYLRDPTYEEAVAFINSDVTDLNPYTQSYVCYDFTKDFIANAQNEGYRCGFVYMEFSSSAHAIACFNTVDQGLIYVEPQNDQLVSVAVGQPYLNYVVLDLGIIW